MSDSELNTFDEAKRVAQEVKDGAVIYVEVVWGPHKGSVARIVDVKHNHYSSHTYTVVCEGKKPFKCKGNTVIIMDNPSGLTSFAENPDDQVEYKDNLGQIILVGAALNFYRPSRHTSGIEIVIGTVREVSLKGVFVQPFRIGNQTKLGKELIRVAKPDCACVLGRETLQNVMLMKLGAD